MKKAALWRATGIFVLAIGVGFFTGYKIPRAGTFDVQSSQTLREHGGYQYISKLLACDFPVSQDTRKYGGLTDSVNDFIAKGKANHELSRMSVYFRDLTDGRWIGVGEDDQYDPASLFKIPTLIAYYRLAATEPDIFSRQIQFVFADDNSKTQNIKPSEVLQNGERYTVDDLLNRMIIYSDNAATNLLIKNIDKVYLENVFRDLELSSAVLTDAGESMSAKSFSLFFRVLYNASYLSRDRSEKALALLAKTDFQDGFQAGIPTGVPIAHKFGEKTFVNPQGIPLSAQLHECGIVYASGHPYLLCVMTEGQSLDKLKTVLRNVSSMVYQTVVAAGITK